MSLFSSSALWRNVKEFIGWIDGGSENTPEFDDLRLVHVGDVRFLAVPVAKGLPVGNEAPKFLTVIDAEDRPCVSGDWVSEQLEIFKSCDTFQPDFLRGVLFISSDADDAVIGAEAQAILIDVGVEWTNTVSYEADQPQLRSGPHLLANGQFFELQRLHDDVQECFVSTVVLPKPASSFRIVPFTGTGSRTLAAAVPSRLQRRAANPVAGLRIAVKDNFHIAGVKTSLCNKAYHALYLAPDRTAACIRRLVDAGAAVVGKTKLASFAATEEPVECVDFSAPWNPRADGYQSPAGSSSGSGAAVAAYAWLDVTLGSDTSGSGRRPGHWNGCVAMRPSHGAVSVEGFVPSFA
ncbi:glutamyl-trna amidotransferase [Neofusicoccum parvum]|nr:glutamyl-trna amidotransferase [Neofusicoccum parvum]